MPKKRPGASRADFLAVAPLAARQHGVVSVRQLYSLGLSDRQVRKRLAVGSLHRLHRGVYAVGHMRLTREGRWLAAVFACGEGGAQSSGRRGALGAASAQQGARDRSHGSLDLGQAAAGRDRRASRGHPAAGGADPSSSDPGHHPREDDPRPGHSACASPARAGYGRGGAARPLHRRRP